jgi:hypothetical protein
MKQPKNSISIFANKKSKRMIIVLIIALLSSVVFIFWQNEKNEQETALKMQYVEQKNQLRDDLDDLIDEHELLKDQNLDLTDQLFGQDSLIKSYADEIKQLLRSKKDLTFAKAKIFRLKEISRSYITAIDSLFTLNEYLKVENDSVILANQKITSRNRSLAQNNKRLADRVYSASVLQLSDIFIEGLHYRASGREVSSTRASKVQNLRICFTIRENKVATPGPKDVYVRIVSPANEVLNVTNKIQEFSFEGTTMQYTTMYSLEYNNLSVDLCELWTRGNQLAEGIYSFEFFIDNELIDVHSFKLR